jgi:hypothetical protein
MANGAEWNKSSFAFFVAHIVPIVNLLVTARLP